MSPTNAERRPSQGGAASAHQAPHDEDHGQRSAPTALPVVSGTELAPIGDAEYARVTVHHQACGHVHLHVKFEVGATTIVRSPACARHTEYRVVITTVVPSAADQIAGAA